MKYEYKNLKCIPVGKFAKVNKNVIYVFKKTEIIDGGGAGMWMWWQSILEIQNHPSNPIWKDDNEDLEIISEPEKKHVDNTIKILKERLETNQIDNLSYIENLNILKNYLKSDIVNDGQEKA